MNRAETLFFLTGGLDYINGCLKDGVSDDKRESLYRDYRKLEDYLYQEARNKLTLPQLVKVETRLRATLKRLDKRFKG